MGGLRWVNLNVDPMSVTGRIADVYNLIFDIVNI